MPDRGDPRPCQVCNQPGGSKLHGPPPTDRERMAARAVGELPRIWRHYYDPGERRHLIRRMVDREAAVQAALERTASTNRRQK